MSAGTRRGPTQELGILLGWLSLAEYSAFAPLLTSVFRPQHVANALLSGAVPPHLEMLSPIFTLPAPHSAWSSCFL